MDKPLLVDHGGRVWVADFGWLEPNAAHTSYSWHPIQRSTVFISTYDNVFRYKWIRPFSVYQFSDADFWFLSALGTVRFDETSGSWCWAAPTTGPLAEDQGGTLWIVDGQIYRYKYEMKP